MIIIYRIVGEVGQIGKNLLFGIVRCADLKLCYEFFQIPESFLGIIGGHDATAVITRNKRASKIYNSRERFTHDAISIERKQTKFLKRLQTFLR